MCNLTWSCHRPFFSFLLISLLLESAALSSGRAASRFQFHFGAPPGRSRMNWGAPPARAAVKDKVAGSLAFHVASPPTKINLHTTTPKSPTNERTNKHTNTQPTKQINKPINNKQTNKQTQENTRTEPLSSLPYHGDDAMVQFRIDMSLNFCCTLLLICFTADPFHCRCISTGPI